MTSSPPIRTFVWSEWVEEYGFSAAGIRRVTDESLLIDLQKEARDLIQPQDFRQENAEQWTWLAADRIERHGWAAEIIMDERGEEDWFLPDALAHALSAFGWPTAYETLTEKLPGRFEVWEIPARSDALWKFWMAHSLFEAMIWSRRSDQPERPGFAMQKDTGDLVVLAGPPAFVAAVIGPGGGAAGVRARLREYVESHTPGLAPRAYYDAVIARYAPFALPEEAAPATPPLRPPTPPDPNRPPRVEVFRYGPR